MQKNFLRSNTALIVYMTTLALIGCGGGSNYNGGGGSNSGGSGGSNSGGSNTPFTLSGTLSGLGTGQSVNLQDNGGDTLALNANGTFSFPLTNLSTGNPFSVTLKSHTPGIRCLVTAGNGTVGATTLAPVNVACGAGTEAVSYSFGGTAGDGQSPNASLVMDNAGNSYGMTVGGGANGVGTIFKITANGAESILHSFGSSANDGQTPNAALIVDSSGTLYGTTEAGGVSGVGTVFKISATGTESVLHSFGATATDGKSPMGSLIMDSAGSLYGTTNTGGAHGIGTVFKVSSTGTESVVYSFGANANDGNGPLAGLIMDGAGNLYGTTAGGGTNSFGTVFKIDSTGAETVLHSFRANNANDAAIPQANLIMDSAGSFYGTTYAGGANNGGAVFKITSTGTESVLYSFGASSNDGKYPAAALIMDSAGNFYGTTAAGGTGGIGTVFKIDSTGAETILYNFGTNINDGQHPQGGLVLDSTGEIHGTASGGGANGFGGVFVID